MICAECVRCGRRSILSGRDGTDRAPQLPGAGGAPLALRCDLCGSRRVRLVQFGSPLEAISFVAKRGAGR